MGGGGVVKVQVHLWNEWEQGHVGRDPTLEVTHDDYYPVGCCCSGQEQWIAGRWQA